MYVLELAGEDDQFAIAEAHAAASNVAPLGPGLASATTLHTDRLAGLAYTRHASHIIANTTGTIDHAVDALRNASLDRTGTAAVHARDIRGTAGIDTQAAERRLGEIIHTHGLDIDLETPDHELRALFANDICVLGWLHASSTRGFGARAPTNKPFFKPGAMDPLDARAVANLAGAAPETTILDVMCGTAGILVEAGLLGADIIGIDVQREMVAGARQNLTEYLHQDYSLIVGDARHLPINKQVDALVFDAPYGRQSKIKSQSSKALIKAALQEARLITNDVVMISDHDLSGQIEPAGWRCTNLFERRVHRSLTRYIHILTQPDTA